MSLVFCLDVVFCLFVSLTGKVISKKTISRPNIVLFVADDLGWNDISYTKATDCYTPNIDELITSGVHFSYHYTMPMCTPTRAALMTGRYPFRYGFQHDSAMVQNIEAGLPLTQTLISEVLHENNYNTYMTGKWHLGYYKWEHTPNYRGFGDFVGYYGNEVDYYDFNNSMEGYTGVDFRFNTLPFDTTTASDTFEVYSKTIERWVDEVQHSTKPFFWYIAHQSPHAPIDEIESYIDIVESYRSYATDARKEYCGLVYGLDEALGGVVKQLRDNNLWDNTYLIFFSDNGAASNDGSAYPFRGVKKTLFEGGIRSPTFVNGGMVPKSMRGQTLTSTIHVTDWFKTICSFASIDCSSFNLDGVDLSEYITKGIEPTRDYIVLNVDLDGCDGSYNGNTLCGGIRYHEWKLVIGSQVDGSTEDYYWDVNFINNPSIDYSQAVYKCTGEEPSLNYSNNCALQKTVCLFNIDDDPCEYYDLSSEFPEIVDQLVEQLQYYYNIQDTPVQLTCKGNSSASDPTLHGGYWAPWRKSLVDGTPFKANDIYTVSQSDNSFLNMIVSVLM